MHAPAEKENWETKLRCICGAGDFATKRELQQHIDREEPPPRTPKFGITGLHLP